MCRTHIISPVDHLPLTGREVRIRIPGNPQCITECALDVLNRGLGDDGTQDLKAVILSLLALGFLPTCIGFGEVRLKLQALLLRTGGFLPTRILKQHLLNLLSLILIHHLTDLSGLQLVNEVTLTRGRCDLRSAKRQLHLSIRGRGFLGGQLKCGTTFRFSGPLAPSQ